MTGDIPSSRIAPVHAYHDGTKHHFHAFARSLGFLDWASQPNPFRSFSGAPAIPLAPGPDGRDIEVPVGRILRDALGLTAWKAFGPSRWSLRANPSSGNLHPTEAYVVAGPTVLAGGRAIVAHYAPDRHALEQRCAFDGSLSSDVVLVVLTSIHWREAWKYGERAFRYCQHDLGHAIAALAVAASLEGLRTDLLSDWSASDIARLVGTDRDEDYVDAEREEPGCVLVLSRGRHAAVVDRRALLAAIDGAEWHGRASQLSADHVQWTFIDGVAEATRIVPLDRSESSAPAVESPSRYARSTVLGRRSAVAFDGRSSLPVDRFFEILRQLLPGSSPLWQTIWWPPRIHLLLFVHRVDDLEPGLYLFEREPSSGTRLRQAVGRQFDFAPVVDGLPLFGLAQADCRRLARHVSCDQDIAADGSFSLGMIAEFDASLEQYGPSFYRHLFWETGFVGQILYLEAERALARGTGIGCFYDDPVHDVLGLTGHAFQSLYHFTVGMPIEDARLTTTRGYVWEYASTST
jgi:nitroreductase